MSDTTPASEQAQATVLAGDIVTALEQEYIESATYRYIIERIASALAQARERAEERAVKAVSDCAIEAIKRIDGLPKPSREQWSVLSWEKYYEQCADIIRACYQKEIRSANAERLRESGGETK